VKFTCSTKDIASAVGAASKIVNAHTTVPILSNVLLTADDGSIRVRATDLELTLEQSFPAEVAESGAVTVPARLFGGYLGNLPAGLLELTGSPSRASVKAERSNYDFHALPADEYPAAAERTKRAVVRDRRQAVPRGRRRDDLCRLERGSARCGADGNVARTRRCDDYAGRHRRIPVGALDGKRSKPASKGRQNISFPSRALNEAARNLGAAEVVELTALGAQSNQLQLSAGTTSIVVRLVDGQYPIISK